MGAGQSYEANSVRSTSSRILRRRFPRSMRGWPVSRRRGGGALDEHGAGGGGRRALGGCAGCRQARATQRGKTKGGEGGRNEAPRRATRREAGSHHPIRTRDKGR